MKINYKITEYFEENNLFDESSSTGLKIKKDNDTLLIKGDSRDLVMLADLLVNVAKEESSHVHVDESTLLAQDSEIKEVIIEKE
ncbi:MAG: hypothetical protein IJL74_00905 [Bacilli bacterium]|nr:hypothetical protein [Bacilli bacterium]